MTKAADLAGKNRSTIQRQIKSGKLSATRDENDQWRIDPAEFHRVYPPNANNAEQSATDAQQTNTNAAQRGATPEINDLVATLRNMVETLQDQQKREVGQLNETIEDLRERLDREASQNRALTSLLTDQRDHGAAAEPPKKTGLFGLFGT